MKNLIATRPDLDETSPRYLALIEFCETNRGLVLASLPFLASEIAGRFGFPALFRLAAWRGGTRIYIPAGKTKDAGADLRSVVGDEAFAWLVSQHQQETIEIPTCGWLQRMETGAAIRKCLAKGDSANATALKVGCHVRTVERWARRLREARARQARHDERGAPHGQVTPALTAVRVPADIPPD